MEIITFILGSIASKAAIILAILVCGIFILRIIEKKKASYSWVKRTNKKLSKAHIPLGIALLVSSFVHALFSSTGILAVFLGTVILIFLALTYATWPLRKHKGFNFMRVASHSRDRLSHHPCASFHRNPRTERGVWAWPAEHGSCPGACD